MYDLSLDAVHTFAVGTIEVVVHNCPSLGTFVKDGGHHIFAKSAFKGVANYSEDQALAITTATFKSNPSWKHTGVNSITS